jgi:transposase-like protein
MSDLDSPKYKNDTAARRHLEAVRWPNGPVCPHCGVFDRASSIKGGRDGLYFCNECRKQYTVTVGTLFEHSKVPLHKWLLANHLICSSKKGISAHQLHRMLGVTYKTAWFMAHRIREAMNGNNPGPMGGKAKIVEADATYFGNPGYEFTNGEGWNKKQGGGDSSRIHTVVERGGRARSKVVKDLRTETIRSVLVTEVDRQSTLMTDEAGIYKTIGKEFRKHRKVNHSKKEYVRTSAYTNTVEGYFSIFKRGMNGVYQHCGEQHLQRYLHEFDFRYSNRKITDAERANEALKGIEGKRMTYKRPQVGR